MKIKFVLKDLTGSQLAARFVEAIDEENVGWDDMDNARLNGNTWVTAWSGFAYTILNPESSEQAVVEYDGACRGFLTQNLLPRELGGETNHAEIIEGSALKRHNVEKFEHSNASDLVAAYGLMQTSRMKLEVCLAAVEAEKSIREYLNKEVPESDRNGSTTFARVGPNSGGHGCINTSDGDPAVYVTCCPGGEQVTLEIQLHPWGSESTAEYAIRRATGWIERLKPVL